MKFSSRWPLFFCFLALMILNGCARPPAPAGITNFLAYTTREDNPPADRFLPILVVENPHDPDNLIGTARASVSTDGTERIFIDPAQASVYRAEHSFSTIKGSYTNHIYRIHFPRVPLSIIPFHIGAGDNVGILIIVTVNSDGQPILYTTLHTCGCYLAFVPTTALSQDAFPTGWRKDRRQTVYGQSLPGILDFSADDGLNLRPCIEIESGSHRITDIRPAAPVAIGKFTTRNLVFLPLAALRTLPIPEGGETSLYETGGGRKGYVKGSQKIWERLLISWWALDWRVGEDKEFEAGKKEGPVFYTSLKPWARNASDLRDFPAFLKYWGWNL